MSIAIMGQVFSNCNLKGTYKLVMLALADHADDYGLAYPGIKRLAVKASCTARRVKQIIKDLQELGEIQVVQRKGVSTNGGKTNLYKISDKYIINKNINPPKEDDDGGDNSDENAPQKVVKSSPKVVKSRAGDSPKVVKSRVGDPPKVVKSRVKGGEIHFTQTINNHNNIPPRGGNKIIQKPSPYTSEFLNRQENKGDDWLLKLVSDMWGREPSPAMIKLLTSPVFVNNGDRSGNYPSPITLSRDETYGELFRLWLTTKKDPRSNQAISKGGMRKWIEYHIINYLSPNGFLTWLEKHYSIMASPESFGQAPRPPRTVKKYNLTQMYMFVTGADKPLAEFEIPDTFRDFYQKNIDSVTQNEEFVQLWEKFQSWKKE